MPEGAVMADFERALTCAFMAQSSGHPRVEPWRKPFLLLRGLVELFFVCVSVECTYVVYRLPRVLVNRGRLRVNAVYLVYLNGAWFQNLFG